MRYRKRKRVATWKVIRRCVLFFTAICVIPVLLVLLVTTDQYMRPSAHLSAASRSSGHPEIPGRLDARHQQQHQLAEKNMSAVQERLVARKAYLRRMCAHMGLNVEGNDSLHRPNPWEFLINRQHHLIWCNVFKAASTSWMYNFNVLAGYHPQFLRKTKQVPLHLARLRYPRPSLDLLRSEFKKSLSFLIVRHPLERLLSGYLDKIQYALPHSLHRKLGSDIIEKYRPKDSPPDKVIRQRYPTFPEFVAYILDAAKNEEAMDMHWMPITTFCTPCLFDFDIIAHTETLQEDQEFLIHKAGLQELIKPEWKNAGQGFVGTARKVEQQYSQITRAQILQLYHIYRYDFELFNYSLQGYLDVAQPDKDPSDLLAAITMKKLHRVVAPAAPVTTTTTTTSAANA